MPQKSLNRIKLVLVENNRSNKWLADQLKKTEPTVSRWCTNDMQPSIETLFEISDVLKVNVRELLVSNR
jgi:transcriptional regulator with XRE-family HTH domain